MCLMRRSVSEEGVRWECRLILQGGRMGKGRGEALDTDPFSSCMVSLLDLAFGRERQRLDQREKKQSGDKRQRQSRKV